MVGEGGCVEEDRLVESGGVGDLARRPQEEKKHREAGEKGKVLGLTGGHFELVGGARSMNDNEGT